MRESANANCKGIAAMRNAGGYSAVTHAAAAAAICRRDVSAISDGLSYFLRDYPIRFLDFYGFEAHCFLTLTSF